MIAMLLLYAITIGGVVVGLRACKVWTERAAFGGHRVALFRDINGDGVEDVILQTWLPSKDRRMFVVALSGVDGGRLWTTEPITLARGNQSRMLGLAERYALVSNDAGDVFAFNLSDGSTAWRMRFEEQTLRFCKDDDDDDHVVVELEDDRRVRMSLVTGGMSESGRTSCDVVEHDDASKWSPSRQFVTELDRRRKSGEMTIVEEAVYGGARVGFGYKTLGNHTLMLEVSQGSFPSSTKWQVAVPKDHPLEAEEYERGSQSFAAGRAIVAATYEVASGPRKICRMTAFSLEEGKRLWDVEIPRSRRYSLNCNEVISMSPKLIVIVSGADLVAFDVETGIERWKV